MSALGLHYYRQHKQRRWTQKPDVQVHVSIKKRYNTWSHTIGYAERVSTSQTTELDSKQISMWLKKWHWNTLISVLHVCCKL